MCLFYVCCGLERCYVGLVAVGVQEQAEDVLVPPLFDSNDISFA